MSACMPLLNPLPQLMLPLTHPQTHPPTHPPTHPQIPGQAQGRGTASAPAARPVPLGHQGGAEQRRRGGGGGQVRCRSCKEGAGLQSFTWVLAAVYSCCCVLRQFKCRFNCENPPQCRVRALAKRFVKSSRDVVARGAGKGKAGRTSRRANRSRPGRERFPTMAETRGRRVGVVELPQQFQAIAAGKGNVQQQQVAGFLL